MANLRSLVISSGTTQQIQAADKLLVGSGIDVNSAAALTVGTSTATAVTIAKAGVVTTIADNLTISGTTTTIRAVPYVWPSSQGSSNTVLTNDGSGNLSWAAGGGVGTVTSVNVSGGTTGLSTSGGPITGSGTITLGGILAVTAGGTGQTNTYLNGQLLIGNSTGNTLTKATLTAGSGVSITNGAGSITISATGSGGTVTSVDVSGGTTGLTTSGGPITGSGTITLAGTLDVDNGGTGQTSYTDGQLLIGNTTGNTLTKATLTAGSGISVTNGSGSITIAATSSATIGGSIANTQVAVGSGVNTISGSNAFTFASGTLTVNNGANAASPLIVQDNGTAVLTVADDGDATIAPVSGHAGDALTVTGGTLSSTKGVLKATATLSSTAATQTAAQITVTGAGSGSNAVLALKTLLNVGYTGSGSSHSGQFYNYSAGTGTDIGNVVTPTGNWGVGAGAFGSTAGTNLGVGGGAGFGNVNVGVAGGAVLAKNSATNVGVAGQGLNTGTSGTQIGGYFFLRTGTPTNFTSAGLLVDNGTTTSPIAVFRDDTTAVLTIGDSGTLNVQNTTNSATAYQMRNAAGTVIFNVDTSNQRASVGTTGSTHTFNVGTGSSSNFAVASGGRIHTYDGNVPLNGEVLIGDTSLGNFAKSTLTAGSGVSIVNGAGSITISATGSGGTVTSIDVSGGTTGLTTSGGPVTSSGTITLAGTLDVDNGGTGQTSYTNGQLLIGNTTGNTLTKATLTAGSGVSITNGAGSITISATGSGGTVTSVDVSGGTTGLTTSGGPVTGSGTITLAGTLAVANGGTGQTSYTNGQLLIGNTTGNTLTKATLTAGSGISITNGTGSITIASTATGTIGGSIATTQVAVGNGVNTISGSSDFTFSSGTLAVNNGSSLNPPLRLQNNGTTVFTVGNGGTLQVRNSLDQSQAYQMQDSAGTVLFNVDTSAKQVGIGTTGVTHTFNVGSGSSSNFAVASGGRIHTYDGTAPTDGQILIGDTALGNFAKATLTAGSGVSITNGAGSITIASTSSATIGGSIANTQVAVGSGVDTIQGSSDFTFASGTLTVNNTASIVNPPLVVQANSTNVFSIAGSGAATFKNRTNGGSGFVIEDASGSRIVTVNTTTQNFGINVGVPSSKLTVFDSSANPAVLINQTGAGLALRVEDSANPDATPFVVSAAGDVGIGTATPAAKLDVSGADALVNSLTIGRGGGNIVSNSAFGEGALASADATTFDNTAIGRRTLGRLVSTSACTAVGADALRGSVVGTSPPTGSTAVGAASLYSITTGTGNTAMGYNAGFAVTTGRQNAYFGYTAGQQINGSDNAAFGCAALGSGAGGAAARNVAIGAFALEAATSGVENVAIGYRSLGRLETTFGCTAVGTDALRGALAGTSPATGSTAVGAGALAGITTGANNTAVGFNAGLSVANSGNNSYFGYFAGQSITSSNNTAMGSGALGSGAGGAASGNTAIGSSALGALLSGSENVCVGRQAGSGMTTSQNNVAVGSYALRDSIGDSNVAIGYGTLLVDAVGSGSVAVGERALEAQTPAAATIMNNVAVGYRAANASTTGTQNTIIGADAGTSITTGSNLTCVGYNAEPSAAGSLNQITLGNASVAQLRCAVNTITLISDQRDKAEIQDLTLGLDFLKTVHPVQFKWDRREWYEGGVSDGSKKQDKFEPGFIAQELDAAQNAADAGWMALTLKDNPDRWEATPMRLFPVVVKACQELAAKASAAEARADAAEARLAALEAAVAALQAQ